MSIFARLYFFVRLSHSVYQSSGEIVRLFLSHYSCAFDPQCARDCSLTPFVKLPLRVAGSSRLVCSSGGNKLLFRDLRSCRVHVRTYVVCGGPISKGTNFSEGLPNRKIRTGTLFRPGRWSIQLSLSQTCSYLSPQVHSFANKSEPTFRFRSQTFSSDTTTRRNTCRSGPSSTTNIFASKETST